MILWWIDMTLTLSGDKNGFFFFLRVKADNPTFHESFIKCHKSIKTEKKKGGGGFMLTRSCFVTVS